LAWALAWVILHASAALICFASICSAICASHLVRHA
jgi:hypothetical protein